MTFKSANRLGFIFKTETGDVKIKYQDHLRLKTYLREFEGTLISVHLEKDRKTLIILGLKNQLLQVHISDVIFMEVL